jgi:hypothetical protein
MITPQQAIQAAVRFLNEIYEGNAAGSVRVEELEREEPSWHVTLSFFPPAEVEPSVSRTMKSILGPERSYKTFEVDAETGEVRSMKIRALQ